MRPRIGFRLSPWMVTATLLATAAGWKALLLVLRSVPFNADEAVVGLMARHILQGERPIFFYGQAYMGSLDAFLVAGGFALLGQQVWVIRLVQALLYLGLIISTIGLGKSVFKDTRVGYLAGALLAIPTVNVTLYTTASLGGYGEALLLGNLILLATIRIANKVSASSGERPRGWLWLAWGILAGLGLWANGLTLIYTVPSFLVLVLVLACGRSPDRKKWKTILSGSAFSLAGFLVGAAPWWIFAISQGWQSLLTELLGSAVAVEQVSWLERTGQHLVNFILLGGTVTFGFRPPWEIRWLGLPLLPFILAFWLAAMAFAIVQLRRHSADGWGRWLLLGVSATLTAGFIFTSFGVDPSGRYFLPFFVPLTLAAGEIILTLVPGWLWKSTVLALILIYQGWGTLEAAFRNPPGITTQFAAVTQVDTHYQDELMRFLRTSGELRGYTNYWVAYPTAFLSGEEVIFVPRLPYHEDLIYTARDDRYRPYDEVVAASQRVAYITTLNPALDERLIGGFRSLQVTWQEQKIGDYHVFYNLSRVVRPEEIGFGNDPG